MPMKIAVAVILAIASAHNGINPKPTMDLDFVEIGPDAVKEDIPGADVFKKTNGGANEDQRIEVTLKAEECETIHGSDNTVGGYECSGSLTAGTAAVVIGIKFGGRKDNGGQKAVFIKNVKLDDMGTDAKDKTFTIMQKVSDATKEKKATGETTVLVEEISKTLLGKIVNEALSK